MKDGNKGLSAVKIVVVDDDPADWLMISEAFEDARVANEVIRFQDGVELMQFLHDPDQDRPGLILLDLNMPRLDGFETLAAIRSDPDLRHLAVVMMTTSSSNVDILKSYSGGANAYNVKPLTFDDMIEAIKTIGQYWIQLVTLPPEKKKALAG